MLLIFPPPFPFSVVCGRMCAWLPKGGDGSLEKLGDLVGWAENE